MPRRWIIITILLLGAGILISLFASGGLRFFRMAAIPVMQPTVHPGDLLLIDTLSHHLLPLRRGELVVFHSTGIPGLQKLETSGPKIYLERLIALPGDHLQWSNEGLMINESLWKPAVWMGIPKAGEYLPENQSVTLQYDEYFVIGDNYIIAKDSRDWGPVPETSLYGRVLWHWKTGE